MGVVKSIPSTVVRAFGENVVLSHGLAVAPEDSVRLPETIAHLEFTLFPSYPEGNIMNEKFHALSFGVDD